MASKNSSSNEAIDVEQVFPRSVAISTIPRNGYQATLTLNDDEKAAICQFYNLLDVLRFEAEMTLTKRTTTKFVVEPEDEFDRFLERKDEDGSLIISLEDDIPDTYQGDKIELGVLVLEHLALGLNPYPQAEGAVLAEGADDGELRQNPFASLASLKDKLKPN